MSAPRRWSDATRTDRGARSTRAPQTPTRDLDFAALTRLELAGGSIRNIALNGAFLAAREDEPVGMSHLWRAARSEYAKLEQPMPEARP